MHFLMWAWKKNHTVVTFLSYDQNHPGVTLSLNPRSSLSCKNIFAADAQTRHYPAPEYHYVRNYEFDLRKNYRILL